MRERWRIFAGTAALLAAGIIAAVLLRDRPGAKTPTLKLPDGSLISIAAVTHGTNHFVGSAGARMVSKLPPRGQGLVHGIFKNAFKPQFQRITGEPRLLVWFHRTNMPAQAASDGYYNAALADGSGFVSGSVEHLSFFPSSPALEFKVFPRRSAMVSVHIYHHAPTGGVHACGSLEVASPIRRKYPHWTPEALPATRRTGDVEVTLHLLVTGHDNNTHHIGLRGGKRKIIRGTDRKDGRNHTLCEVIVRNRRNTNESWKVANEEISDATGNASRNNSMSWNGDDESFVFMPSLWPDERAWRIKMELKREKGFDASEQFTFREIPFGAINVTNSISATTNFGGVKVTLENLIRRRPNTNESWSSDQLTTLKVTHSPLPEGTHLDLVSATTEEGTNLVNVSSSSMATERSYGFRTVPGKATRGHFTFVVHQSRTVEFIVKPEVAEAGEGTR